MKDNSLLNELEVKLKILLENYKREKNKNVPSEKLNLNQASFMNEINKNVQISIFGQEYSVKAPADASYIKKIAEYLDSKMREVQEGFSSTQSSTRIAILAAMNITDELFNARQSGDSNDNELDEKLSSLIEIIDENI